MVAVRVRRLAGICKAMLSMVKQVMGPGRDSQLGHSMGWARSKSEDTRTREDSMPDACMERRVVETYATATEHVERWTVRPSEPRASPHGDKVGRPTLGYCQRLRRKAVAIICSRPGSLPQFGAGVYRQSAPETSIRGGSGATWEAYDAGQSASARIEELKGPRKEQTHQRTRSSCMK